MPIVSIPIAVESVFRSIWMNGKPFDPGPAGPNKPEAAEREPRLEVAVESGRA